MICIKEADGFRPGLLGGPGFVIVVPVLLILLIVVPYLCAVVYSEEHGYGSVWKGIKRWFKEEFSVENKPVAGPSRHQVRKKIRNANRGNAEVLRRLLKELESDKAAADVPVIEVEEESSNNRYSSAGRE